MSRRLCCSHCSDRPVLARAAGSSTVPTGIERSINPEQLGALAVRSAVSVQDGVAIGGGCVAGTVTWDAETALLVLCMCLYGPALLHVLRVHAVCGYRGPWS